MHAHPLRKGQGNARFMYQSASLLPVDITPEHYHRHRHALTAPAHGMEPACPHCPEGSFIRRLHDG